MGYLSGQQNADGSPVTTGNTQTQQNPTGSYLEGSNNGIAGGGNMSAGNGGGSSGIAGALGLGLTSNFDAQQYNIGQGAQWGGPSSQQLGNQTWQYGQQGQGALGQVNGADRAAQQGYLAQLAQMGSNNSAAQAQLQQGVNAANSSALSLARSAGGNPAQQAAALRNAQMTQAGNIQNAGAQSAQLQAQQQQAAAALQGGVLQNMSGQDLTQAQLAAQQQQGYLGSQLGAAGQDLQAQEANNALNSSNFNAAQGLNQSTSASNAATNGAVLGAVASGAGKALASDARLKRDIAPASDDTSAADSFLSTLKPYTFAYKDPEDAPSPGAGTGRYLGVMAQNVEKGPTGETMVTETPRGKALEQGASMGAALAGIGRLHERLSALEGMAARTKQSAGAANA